MLFKTKTKKVKNIYYMNSFLSPYFFFCGSINSKQKIIHYWENISTRTQ